MNRMRAVDGYGRDNGCIPGWGITRCGRPNASVTVEGTDNITKMMEHQDSRRGGKYALRCSNTAYL